LHPFTLQTRQSCPDFLNERVRANWRERIERLLVDLARGELSIERFDSNQVGLRLGDGGIQGVQTLDDNVLARFQRQAVFPLTILLQCQLALLDFPALLGELLGQPDRRFFRRIGLRLQVLMNVSARHRVDHACGELRIRGLILDFEDAAVPYRHDVQIRQQAIDDR